MLTCCWQSVIGALSASWFCKVCSKACGLVITLADEVVSPFALPAIVPIDIGRQLLNA